MEQRISNGEGRVAGAFLNLLLSLDIRAWVVQTLIVYGLWRKSTPNFHPPAEEISFFPG